MYAGVNPVETYIREGQYSKLPQLPYTPGSDASGYVEAIGSKVSQRSHQSVSYLCKVLSFFRFRISRSGSACS